MTSSVHEYSDGSELDKQQNYSEMQVQSSSATRISEPGLLNPNIRNASASPQLGKGHPMNMAHGVYPYPDPYYRFIFAHDAQPYLPHSQPVMQLMGTQQAGAHLRSDAMVEPVFVNVKQYQGILRRRQSRAKAESDKRKITNSRKPYLHESRHLHALRRARRCGGRFANAKKDDQQKQETSCDRSQLDINLNLYKNDHASSDSMC